MEERRGNEVLYCKVPAEQNEWRINTEMNDKLILRYNASRVQPVRSIKWLSGFWEASNGFQVSGCGPCEADSLLDDFFSGTKWAEVTKLPWAWAALGGARSSRAHVTLKKTSPSPVSPWFRASAQLWPAARPLIPDLADIARFLQFPPKEAEVANITAHDFFLVSALCKAMGMFWSRTAPWASNITFIPFRNTYFLPDRPGKVKCW